MVSPEALLGVFLVRLAGCIPPSVTLPAVVGGRGSLNLYCGLVGSSGAGKGAAIAASEELMPWANPWAFPGSGEGVLRLFVTKGSVKRAGGEAVQEMIQHTTRAAMLVDEIDMLSALGKRQGANLLPVLRTAWSGGALGFGYADDLKRLSVPAHKYRLAMVVGAQPERCADLFADQDGGTPQRFIWVPLVDPGAPDTPPEDPGPLQETLDLTGSAIELTVPESVVTELRDLRRSILRTGDTGGIASHTPYNRLKIAALVAIAERRIDLTPDDWDLAGHIQSLSDQTREEIQSTLKGAEMRRREARVKQRVEQDVASHAAIQNQEVGRAARAIALKVHRAGGEPVARGVLRKTLTSNSRHLFEDAVDIAEGLSWVVRKQRTHPTNGSTSDVFLAGEEKP
jgi:hypothetical protein